ncbi:hypothetical protein EBZ39_10460, partial [bacterium]|nr:hypothetical protein [bacterium]
MLLRPSSSSSPKNSERNSDNIVSAELLTNSDTCGAFGAGAAGGALGAAGGALGAAGGALGAAGGAL